MFENLESRLLLSVTYPNMLSIDAPLANPTLPGGVQIFVPPVASLTPPSTAPLVADYTRTGSPNQTLAFSGAALSTFTGADFGKDTEFITYGQTTSGNGTLVDAQIQLLNGTVSGITLDASLPADSMYLIWAQNSAGDSYPMAVNRTQAWWVGPNRATRGDTVSVYGENLCSGATPTSYVFLQAPGAGTGVWATVTSANPYQVNFTVPAGLTNGTYEVWVHDGRGGQYGWSTPYNADGTRMTVSVDNGISWSSNLTTYNVKTAYGAVGDGVHDDTPNIQNAINAAAAAASSTNRLTVYIPTGTYLLKSQLTMASNVQIVGDGKDGNGNYLSKLVRSNGLVCYIPFYDGNSTGSLGDAAGLGDTATYLPSGTPSYVAGFNNGKMISLNGAHYVALSGSNLGITGKITLAGRAQISSSTGTQTIVANTDASGNGVFLRMQNGYWQVGVTVGGVTTVAQTAVIAQDLNAIVWVSGQYDGTAWKLYLYSTYRSGPALAASTTSGQGCPTLTGTWTIGADKGGTADFLTGSLQDVRIYNTDLPLTAVQWDAWGWWNAFYNVVTATATSATKVAGLEITSSVQPRWWQDYATTGLVVVNGTTDAFFDNVRIVGGQFDGIYTGAETRLSITNSTLTGWTQFIGESKGVILDHDNFYGQYDGDQLIGSWGGQYMSITNCTGRNYNETDASNPAGWSGGRFYVGSTPGASNRYLYIANNTTTNLGPRPGKPDQNAGEQILWDQNDGNLLRATMTTANATSVTISGTIGSNTVEVAIDGATGVGQYRRVKSSTYNSGANTTQIFLDTPWGVIPDATSSVLVGRVAANIAIYNNTLNGRSDYASRTTAMTGVKFFNDGFDVAIDHNTISNVDVGVALNGLYQTAGDLPLYGFQILNNQVSNVVIGGTITGTLDLVHSLIANQVWRNNTLNESGNTGSLGIQLESAMGVVIEGNTIQNTTLGIGAPTASNAVVSEAIVRNNTLSLGTAPASGSTGIVTTSDTYININSALQGNTFSGFASNFANTTNLKYYGSAMNGGAVANNGRVYQALNTTLSGSSQAVLNVFDPQNPLTPPQAFLSGVSGGTNGNLRNSVDLVFTNTGYIANNANPVSCNMYVLNAGNGTVSKYTFDAAGNMAYNGDIITGLSGPVAMVLDTSGNLLITVTGGGTAPKVYKWNGSTLTTLIDTPLFVFQNDPTTRTPGGIALDSSGRIYIPYNSVPGIRRFTAAGAKDVDYSTAGNCGRIEQGPDGLMYFSISGPSIYTLNPSNGTLASFVTTTTCPDLSGQGSLLGLVPGPKTITDPNTGDSFNLYLASYGARFMAAAGPGAASPGSQLNFRNDVYPVANLPYRALNASVAAGGNGTATLPIYNSSPVAASYTVTPAAAWLTVTSGGSGTIGAQGSVNVGLSINASSLGAGTYTSDITYSITGPTGSIVQKATLALTVTAAAATVTLSATDASASETGPDNGVFTVTRTGPTTSALVVNYTITGTATNTSDYSTLATSVSIPAGQTSATITVTPVNDTLIEGNETVILTLASGSYTIGSPSTGTVTIADNDVPAITISATDANASETGPDTGTFTVTRTGSGPALTTGALTVNFTITGTATNTSDYSTLTTSVVIPDGQPSATITVTPVDDASVEGSETVILTLASGTGYTIGAPSTGTVTIADNDSAATWTDQDIGAVGVPGSYSYNAGTYTVNGSGTVIWGSSDQCNFLWQPMTGDGTVTARVASVQNIAADTLAGVMFRDTLAAGSKEVFMAHGPTTMSAFDRRTATNGSTDHDTPGGTSVPYWVRLVRSGNSFSAYQSPDGTTWTQVGATQSITMASTIYIGLAVVSGNNSQLCTATFDNVTVPGASTPTVTISATDANASETGPDTGTFTVTRTTSTGALTINYTITGTATNTTDYSTLTTSVVIPDGATSATITVTPVDDSSVESSETVILTLASGTGYTIGAPSAATVTIADNDSTATWTDQDIGSPGVAGSYSYSAGTYTVSGSGAAVWGSSDQCNFLWQQIAGDCTVTARVASVQNIAADTLAGVMFRETLAAGSTEAYMAHGPTTMSAFDRRTTTNGSTDHDTPGGTSVPYWVRLVRSGNSFSAYQSSNGTTWIQVGATQSITMASTIYVGLAVVSGSNSQLCTATFDNVLITYAQDDFETGNGTGGSGWAGNWSFSGAASVVNTGTPHGGSYHLQLTANTGVATRTVDLTDAPKARLQFYWKANAFVAGNTATVEVYDGSWHTVLTVSDGQDDNAYHLADLDLAGYSLTSNFQIRIKSNMTNGSNYFYIDDLKIVQPG